MRRTLLLFACVVAIGSVVGQPAPLPPPVVQFGGGVKILLTEAAPAEKAPASDPPRGDVDVLKAVNLKTDAASLLDYLRKQTHPEADPKQMDNLIRELGDDIFQTREAAYARIITLGKTALVALKEAAERDPDPEIKHRSADLRKMLEAKVEPAIQVATARLLARMKPAGAVETLLNFLPCAPDLSVTEEVCRAIDATAVVNGHLDPVVASSLDDPRPIRRASAAQAILLAKNVDARSPEQLSAARKLLKDADPLVRLRVGLAMVQARDSAAVSEALPVLIECLDHLPPENLWRVEDLLIRLAGEGKGPTVSLGTNEESRKVAYEAWNQWYAKSHKDVDLAKLDQSEPYLGRTLIIYRNFNRFNGGGIAVNGRIIARQAGEIVEIDKNKEVKWKLALEDSDAVDAELMPDNPNQVVIAEFQKGRVTIRDHTKKDNNIVWEKQVGGNPIGVQPTSDGKIFVVLQNRILEIDRVTKAERVIVTRQVADIYRAKRTKSGDIVYVTNAGLCVRLNAEGTKVKEFQGPNIPVIFGGIDILPNGNVVLPDFQGRRVVEYDINGNQVSQISTEWPSAASRLPNGNTLVASQNTRRVVEYNRDGQEVWSYTVEGQVFNAHRR